MLDEEVTGIPAVPVEERERLAELDSPEDLPLVVQAHRRLAAIAELMRRAKVAVPIQNEAVVYQLEALTRMARLVDEGQASGEIETLDSSWVAKTSLIRTSPRSLAALGPSPVRLLRDLEARHHIPPVHAQSPAAGRLSACADLRFLVWQEGGA